MRSKRVARIIYKEASDSEDSAGSEPCPPRKKSKANCKSNDEYARDLSSDSDFETSKRTKKPKAKGKGKAQSKKGRGPVRQNLIDILPVELFTEILTFLSPKDLLALARTNKEYRASLMSKTRSEYLWKKSFKSVKLPELVADDWSLPAYADLIFAVRCSECGRYSPSWMDPWLRRRLCKVCRKSVLIDVHASYISENNLHPLLGECILRSPIRPDGYQHWAASRKTRAHVEDVDEIEARLVKLQALDQVEIDAGEIDCQTLQRSILPRLSPWRAPDSAPNPLRAKPPPVTAGRSRRSSAGQKSYVEEPADDDDDEEFELYQIGPRVTEFVKDRQRIIEAIDQDASELYLCGNKVAARIRQEDEANAKRLFDQQFEPLFPTADFREYVGRLVAVRHRLDATDGYECDDLHLIPRQGMKLLYECDTRIDDAWSQIKPEVLHLIDVEKKKRAIKDKETNLFAAEVNRKNSLRKYYDKLLEDVDEWGQYPPLFDDFLCLPSVRSLWKRRDATDLRHLVTGIEWIMKREAVLLELEEYHLDLVNKAVRLILSTTREYETEADLDDAVEAKLAGNLDAFFDEATSMVCCDAGCETKILPVDHRWSWRRTWYPSHVTKKREAFFGTFPEIVEHQLAEHNTYVAKHAHTPSEKRHYELQFRFHLPLEVASAMSDLVDFFRSDDPVSVNQLAALNQGSLRLSNMGQKCRFPTWESLIGRVYVVARKAARARPPVALEPPDITFKPPRVWPPVDDSSDDSGDDPGVKDDPDENFTARRGGRARGGGGSQRVGLDDKVQDESDDDDFDHLRPENDETYKVRTMSENLDDNEQDETSDED